MSEFWDIQFKDLVNIGILGATIFAIYYGPIKAVQISRQNEKEDGKRARQLAVFHNLIKTRRFLLSPDHVTALNLVQLEFYGAEKVQSAYKTYIGILGGPWPKVGDSDTERFINRRDNTLYDLLHEIGLVLGFVMDRQELKQLAYGPTGWENDESEQKTLRHLLIEMLQGSRPVPTADFAKMKQIGGKFPPPPT